MKSNPQSFWKWFLANEEMLFHFDIDLERVFDQLAAQLHQIDEHLTFEFSPVIDGRREFIISADGIREAFPSVLALINAAPELERWQIIGFRPRRSLLMPVAIRDKEVDPNEVEFTILSNGKSIGIFLFLPGYDDEDETWKMIGYLLLDEMLGEFDVETKVGFIEMFSSGRLDVSDDSGKLVNRLPLPQLPEIFDNHVFTLQRRNNDGFNPPRPS